jgi:heterotetrameric sarcosine oxidase gamma subunit
VVAEQRATREQVALFDQTSFGKLRIHGPDALALLQWCCTADVDTAVGVATYTGMLNRRAGYEADVTVTRVASEEWLLITSAGSPVRDADWLRRSLRPQWRVAIEDVTTAYAVFGLMGPRSREVLRAVTAADLTDAAFPFGTSQALDLGVARARATRMTYVGELGWELLVPTELAGGVWDLLTEAGEPHGLRLAGYTAMNALRLEKGYRAWGAELGPERNPLEAGLLFTCKLASAIDFSGRAALEAARTQGPSRRLVSVVARGPRCGSVGRRTSRAGRGARGPGDKRSLRRRRGLQRGFGLCVEQGRLTRRARGHRAQRVCRRRRRRRVPCPGQPQGSPAVREP